MQIFFVISGFIMVMTTMRRPITPAAFLQHRIIRVVPTYWILTSVATVLLMAGLHILGQGGVAPVQLLKSLAFVPDFTAEASMRLPVLFVGWTLNYEMMFYVLFALCLFVPVPTQRLWAISVALLTLWIAGQSGDQRLSGLLGQRHHPCLPGGHPAVSVGPGKGHCRHGWPSRRCRLPSPDWRCRICCRRWGSHLMACWW